MKLFKKEKQKEFFSNNVNVEGSPKNIIQTHTKIEN